MQGPQPLGSETLDSFNCQRSTICSASSCSNDKVWLAPCTLSELNEAQVSDTLTPACAQLLQSGAALAQQCKGPVAELGAAAQVEVRQAAALPHQRAQPAVRQLMAA